MSASNWRTCPRCEKNRQAAFIEYDKKVVEAYGKVSPEEYDALRASHLSNFPLQDTLREDYEQGMDSDGTYSVDYDCHCSTCGFAFSFNKTVDAKP